MTVFEGYEEGERYFWGKRKNEVECFEKKWIMFFWKNRSNLDSIFSSWTKNGANDSLNCLNLFF